MGVLQPGKVLLAALMAGPYVPLCLLRYRWCVSGEPTCKAPHRLGAVWQLPRQQCSLLTHKLQLQVLCKHLAGRGAPWQLPLVWA